MDGLETMMIALDIDNHKRKWALMLHYGGEKMRTLEKQIDYDKTAKFDEAEDNYRCLKEALTTHFAPSKNTTYASFLFHSMMQEEGELIDSYVTRLRKQAKLCGFCNKDCTERAIRNQIVVGCKSQRMRRKALSEDLQLDRLIQTARAEESANANAQQMEKNSEQLLEPPSDVFKVSKRPGKYSGRSKVQNALNPPHEEKRCFSCGGAFPHAKERPCPAKGKNCNKCGRVGHFASCCRGGNKSVLAASAVDDLSDDEEHYVGLGRVMLVGSVSKTKNVTVHVNGLPIKFRPDTGADVTLIGPDVHNNMNPKPHLSPSNNKLLTYGAKTDEALKIRGCFPAELIVGNKTFKDTIYVSQAVNRGISLLSTEASEDLGFITFNIPPSVNEVTTIPAEGSNSHPLLKDFDDICHGVGRHKDLAINLPLKEGAKPSIAPPSRIPVNLYSKVKKELDRLIQQGVFEDVPVDDNTQFVSRLVPVPKRIEGSDEVGVRLTMDWRELNKNLDPVHHSVPTVEQLRHDLNGAKLFSQIDLRDAFYQLPLDEESKRLTTFSTPWGLKRSTRLVQGAVPSSSICHETLRRDLQGISGALNIADNILVWGCGDSEEDIRSSHDRALLEVLQMFRRTGLTLNKRKCIFNATSTKFFGFLFSSEGILADPDKIEALRNAERPKTKEEVRSFLGMAGFNSQFIPGYATVSEPLRDLTKKNLRFVWGKREEQAFRVITQAISETTMLNYYDTNKQTALFTDASPVGVNATLAQLDENGIYRPVHIASRSLTTTEQAYDQLEREAVAMHFGCFRFKIFLEGTHFFHYIDPEPLKAMMDKAKKEAPARIDKVRLKLQGFSREIKLIKGKENPADYLSRHPLPISRCSKEERRDYADIENYLFVVANMLPEAITNARVQEETCKDVTLSKIIDLLHSGVTSLPSNIDKNLQPFRFIWTALSTVGGLLLRGDRVVLPKSLIKDALKIAHAGHMGICKTKRYLRSCVWFPNMDSLVEEEVRRCIPCAAVTPSSVSEPLLMTPLPPEPWQLIAADIFGPIPSGEKILVLKCLRSKWPEVQVLLRNQSANAETVINAMEKIFLTHGIPDTVRSDNGPPFNSAAYRDFGKRAGFKIQRVTPLWPQANGQAEAFMKCLGKVIRTAHIEGKNWRKVLDEFLLAYRATPHPSTNASPAGLMYPNRRYKTRLPGPPACPVEEDAAKRFHDGAMRKAKLYADGRRHAKICKISMGDSVLVRQQKRNKLSSFFNPNPFIVTAIKGSMVTASRGDKKVTRNSSFFKVLPPKGRSVPHQLGQVPGKTVPVKSIPAAQEILSPLASASAPNGSSLIPDTVPGDARNEPSFQVLGTPRARESQPGTTHSTELDAGIGLPKAKNNTFCPAPGLTVNAKSFTLPAEIRNSSRSFKPANGYALRSKD